MGFALLQLPTPKAQVLQAVLAGAMESMLNSALGASSSIAKTVPPLVKMKGWGG